MLGINNLWSKPSSPTIKEIINNDLREKEEALLMAASEFERAKHRLAMLTEGVNRLRKLYASCEPFALDQIPELLSKEEK